jgi:propanediol utilization protein
MNPDTLRDIVAAVVKQVCAEEAAHKELPVEISGRHVHLSREDINRLFGEGYELTPKKPISQPGQFLCEERVKLATAHGEFANVAVLGPERPHTQIEISATDARVLGLEPPVRLSGDLAGACDVLIIAGQRFIEAKGCVIIAKNHVHMTPLDAERYGVHNGQLIDVMVAGERPLTFRQVPIRVADTAHLAMHIDFDEANACSMSGKGVGIIEA